MRVGLFITCLTDTLYPEAGKATVAVLERLGHEVVVNFVHMFGAGDLSG
jgi:L-lactate dehydrogenase complex protein LldE